MLLRFWRWLFEKPKYREVRNLSYYARKRIPWWCMNEKHQPYLSEDAYDAHMLEVHHIDVSRSYQNKVRTDIRT